MEASGELTYQKNLGYYWITGLGKIGFVILCASFGAVVLALMPVLFAAVELTRPKKTLADQQVQAQDAVITVFGCLVTSLSMITLFVGFMAGEWIWAQCFFGLYGFICALFAGLLGLMVLTYESHVDEENSLVVMEDATRIHA